MLYLTNRHTFILRFTMAEDPQWVLSMLYRFHDEVVKKVRDGTLSDQEKTRLLGVLQYSRIRLPYDRFPFSCSPQQQQQQQQQQQLNI